MKITNDQEPRNYWPQTAGLGSPHGVPWKWRKTMCALGSGETPLPIPAPGPCTYPTGPDVVGVSHGLPLVELVHLLQLLPVHVGLCLLVGKTADSLHGRDGLLSRVVSLGQSTLHILGEFLQGAGGGRGSSVGARLPVAHLPACPRLWDPTK